MKMVNTLKQNKLFFAIIIVLLSASVSFGAKQNTYPTKATPVGADKALIVDSVDNSTKQANLNAMRAALGLGTTADTVFGTVNAAGGTLSSGVAGTTQGALILYTNTDPVYVFGITPAASPTATVSLKAPPAMPTVDDSLWNCDINGTCGWTDPATLGGGATTLDGLTDVDTAGAASGSVIKYNGTSWVIGTDDAGSGSVPNGTVNGQLLIWATDQWVASSVPTWNQNTTGTAAGITGYSIVTTVGATGSDTNLPSEQGVREAISALPEITVETTPTNGAGARVPASAWAIMLDANGNGSVTDDTWWTTAMSGKLNVADIDDTPVNAETAQPISSNWAYDHDASTAAHGATGEVVGTTNTQTLTNKSIAAVEVDGSASGSLTAAQVSSTIITNRGQAASDVALTLPTAAAGYAAVFTVGTAQSNKWGVQAGTNDKIYLIAAAGTVTAGSDNGYARMTAAQVGQSFACWTFQVGTSEWDWMCKAGSIGTSTFAAN